MPEASGAATRGAGPERRLALEQQDPAGPRVGQVVRGARADGAAADDHDVRGLAHARYSSPRYASRIRGLASSAFDESASTICPVCRT